MFTYISLPFHSVNYLVENIKASTSGSEVMKKKSCSTQLSTEFILLINVKMPTIVGILTFIITIYMSYKSLKA